MRQGKAAAYHRLAGFAERIAKLLGSDQAKRRSGVIACLDDLLGAVYSLIYATYCDYTDRPDALEPPDINAVLARAVDMSNLQVRTEGKWTAGTYFNSALFRIAAVYHRSLKIITGREERGVNMPTLVPIAKELFARLQGVEWQNTNLHEIHSEVTELKHTPGGVYEGRGVTFNGALEAVNELLNLLEASI